MEQLKFTFEQVEYAHQKYLEKCNADFDDLQRRNPNRIFNYRPLNFDDFFKSAVSETHKYTGKPNFIEEYIIPNLEGYENKQY
jgi:hypothetical protein